MGNVKWAGLVKLKSALFTDIISGRIASLKFVVAMSRASMITP